MEYENKNEFLSIKEIQIVLDSMATLNKERKQMEQEIEALKHRCEEIEAMIEAGKQKNEESEAQLKKLHLYLDGLEGSCS